LTLDPVKADPEETNTPYGAFHHPVNTELGHNFLPAFSKLLETGVIKPNTVKYLPGGLAGISAGFEKLKRED